MLSVENSRTAVGCHAGTTRRAWLLGALGGLAFAPLPNIGTLFAQPADPALCNASDPKCPDRMKEHEINSKARQALNRGDAYAANDLIDQARDEWQEAIDLGFATGAQASVIAQKRMQMYTLTCSYNEKSLKALATAMNGKLVNMIVIQKALVSLGYYEGPCDGKLTVQTRSAIRKFQRDMALDETGTFDKTDELQQRHIVYLICNAAETARDSTSLTTLALMYAAGIGVVQSNNFALALLRKASDREHGPATFYLAIIHGTGYCTFPKRLDLADQYLKEACQQHHAGALDLFGRHGSVADPELRWIKIGVEKIVKDCLEILGPCPPPPAPKKNGS